MFEKAFQNRRLAAPVLYDRQIRSMNVYFGIRPETPAELAAIAANTLLAHVL